MATENIQLPSEIWQEILGNVVNSDDMHDSLKRLYLLPIKKDILSLLHYSMHL